MEELERAFSEAIRSGMYREAAAIVFSVTIKPLIDTITELGERIDRLSEIVERNSEDIAKLTERMNKLGERMDGLAGIVERNSRDIARLGERIARLSEIVERNSIIAAKISMEVDRLVGDIGRWRGWLAESEAIEALREWFRRHDPRYEVIPWRGMGTDALVWGRGLLASVEIAIRPSLKDLRQLKDGIRAVQDSWGRKPDLLVLYSVSGEFEERVIVRADEEGIRLVRSPKELKEVLDLLEGNG